MNQPEALFGNLIHSYTRAEAISDGVLVDISATAREAGFRIHVAMTGAAWEDCVAWDASDSTLQAGQDEAGRLWDVAWMASLAARRGRGDQVEFELLRVPRGGRGRSPQRVVLSLHIGPGDTGEPVMTVMLPGED